MNILLAAGLAFALVAVLFLLSTFRHLRRRRPVRATGSLAGGAASGAVGGATLLMAFTYIGYDRLVGEVPVSQIQFAETAPGRYQARLMITGEADRLFELRGDEWQLDARVINWKPPATLLGLDPVFKLERLSGRYTRVDDELSAPRTVHSLADEQPIDIWNFARRYPRLLPGVDAYYGTATYVPMADGARFEVTMTRTALIARPMNDAARRAVGEWGSQ